MSERKELRDAVDGDSSPPVPLDPSHPPDFPKSLDGFDKQSTNKKSFGFRLNLRRSKNGVTYETDIAAGLQSSSQRHEATSAALPKKSLGDKILSSLEKIYSFARKALNIRRRLIRLIAK